MTHYENSQWEALLLHVTVDAGVCMQEVKELTCSHIFLLHFVQHTLKFKIN